MTAEGKHTGRIPNTGSWSGQTRMYRDMCQDCSQRWINMTGSYTDIRIKDSHKRKKRDEGR